MFFTADVHLQRSQSARDVRHDVFCERENRMLADFRHRSSRGQRGSNP